MKHIGSKVCAYVVCTMSSPEKRHRGGANLSKKKKKKGLLCSCFLLQPRILVEQEAPLVRSILPAVMTSPQQMALLHYMSLFLACELGERQTEGTESYQC